MRVHINYAHGRYLRSQQLCSKSAVRFGFDVAKPFRFRDLDSDFVEENGYTLSMPRGAGFWLWKPYLILKMLGKLRDHDWLMYTDSGMYFVRDPWEMISSKFDEIADRGFATFGKCGINREYTKRDTFILMGMDEPKYTDAVQRMAGIIICRPSKFSRSFLKEWLHYATDPRIITDIPNTQRKPNYPEFKDHRHDQSILSLLCLKHGVYTFDTDLTQYSSSEPYLLHPRDPR